MIQDTSRDLFSLFLWSFLPTFFSTFVLNQYHRMRYPSVAARPKKGSKTYRKHYILAYTSVMVAYFAYCVGQAGYDLPENYYSKLGVARERASTDLKARFKTLVMQLHPDKVPNADPQRFLEVKHLYEILENKDMRVAYEVFGQDALTSATTSSKRNKNARINLRDLFESAFMNWSVYYVGSIIVLLTMSIIMRKSGMFWRMVSLSFCACAQLYTMTRPRQTLALDISLFSSWGFLARYTVHEKLAMLKTVLLNLSILVSQLISVSEEPKKTVLQEVEELSKEIEALSGRLGQMADDEVNDVKEFLEGEKNESLAKAFQASLGKSISTLKL